LILKSSSNQELKEDAEIATFDGEVVSIAAYGTLTVIESTNPARRKIAKTIDRMSPLIAVLSACHRDSICDSRGSSEPSTGINQHIWLSYTLRRLDSRAGEFPLEAVPTNCCIRCTTPHFGQGTLKLIKA